jgi:CDP-diacylglycerol--glycerol-3-phosphate 3-phosphatidyltransferase
MKIRDLFKGRVYTVSNFLSLIRIIVAPYIGWYMYLESITGDPSLRYYQLGCFAVIILSDFFDGYLARLLKQETKLGQFLDPFADKISALLIIFMITLFKEFPVWLCVFIFIREIVVFTAAVFLYSKRDVEVKPNIFGKICVAVGAVTALIYTLSMDAEILGFTLKNIFISLIVLFYILGGILYVKTYSDDYFRKK